MATKVKIFSLFTIFCLFIFETNAQKSTNLFQNDEITVGAERFGAYIKKLKNKRVGLVINQTSVIGKNGETHIVDALKSRRINIKAIYAPEHGFRGKADAGEKVDNTVDEKTGIPVISIYGKKRAPDANDMNDIDVLIFDIQDVGTRYYTYISTLEYVMIAAAEFKKSLIILDRPNPNGHFVDGPILEKELKSFVGMQQIPIVHGMTVGEYAMMLNTEGWLKDKAKADIFVVKCKGYNHNKFYSLPIKPSPNLPNMHSIYLYTSICFFEGTDVSLGRGTSKQFQIYGAPQYAQAKSTYSFTPMPNEGAKEPPLNGKLCYGHDLSTLNISDLQKMRKVNLSYLFDAYNNFGDKSQFFLKNNFIDKLAGTKMLREQILAGKSAEEIYATWQTGINKFKQIRKKYLLYADFE